MTDPTQPPATYHFTETRYTDDGETWTPEEADALLAIVERWFCVAMLLISGIMFAGLTWYGFGVGWLLVGIGCFGWAGARARV